MFPMNMFEYNDATISIGKPQGGRRDGEKDIARIEITDGRSRRRIISIEVDLETFAKALFGLAFQPCQYQVTPDPAVWGKKKETKHVLYPTIDVYDKNVIEEYLAPLVAEDEVGGWKGMIRSSLDSRQPVGSYKINFERFVDVEEDNGT